jgi:hypothetical protein
MKLATVKYQGLSAYGIICNSGIRLAREKLHGRYSTLRNVISAGVLNELDADVNSANRFVANSDLAFLPPLPEAGKNPSNRR